MMGSSNLGHHHHQQYQQQQPRVSSSLADPSFHVVGSNHACWNPNLILNDDGLTSDFNGVISSSKDFRQGNEIVVPTLRTSMIQDLGFHWPENTENYTSHSTLEVHLGEIKEELSADPSPKFSSTLRDTSNLEDYHLPSTSYIKHEQGSFHDLREKHFLKSLSSSSQINGLQLNSSGEFLFGTQNAANYICGTTSSGGNYSMVLPTANVPSSKSSSSSSPFQSSLGMDFQALDFLASAKFGGSSFSYPSINNLAALREDISFGLGHIQEPTQIPLQRHHKTSSLGNGVTEAKRASGVSEHKEPQSRHKKPRFESRSSFSPFKVRKEKLGDRIAALQQLVAPFGKTDTASVLMEAVGYIKFLQDQVETLSVPYLRSSSNSKFRTAQGVSSEGRDEPKLDLRSRGLCLVPLSCTSYITSGTTAGTATNGGVWPSPPNFRGGI